MFNIVNIHDFCDCLKKSKKVSSVLASRLSINRNKRVMEAWKHTSSPPTNWWNIPRVTERWNSMISGDSKIDFYQYIKNKYLFNDPQLRGLSFGCGTGSRELSWAKTHSFSCIDAFDLSEPRIKVANENAVNANLDNILNYRAGDAFQIPLHLNHYDVAFGEGSLHHFSPLEEIILKIKQAIKPGGYFIINEYVGPTRFQWTDRQLQVVNNILALLPHHYKLLWDKKSVKEKVFRPSRLRMLVSDPSEAVESSNILPLLKKHFDTIEIKGFGGAVLHMLFSEIAHNFLSKDNETERWLDTCFAVEDLLLTNGDIHHDFVVAVFKKAL
jgi:SAM-dependent methyltransferase